MMITSISATNNDDNLTIPENTFDNQLTVNNVSCNSNETLNIPDIEIPDAPDAPDLIVNETYYVHQNDIVEYFSNGVLDSKYSNKILIFTGNFNNLGKLIIDVDNVTIMGDNSYLRNTVFDISGENVVLSNLNIDLDSEFENNDYAGIIVSSDNVIFTNLKINYLVPRNTEAYVIYAVGNPKKPAKNLKILNSYIHFEGHNDDYNVYNNAVKILYYKDSLMNNNTITTSLPLKNVNYGSFGATLDSEFVLTVGFEKCDNYIFTNNNLIAEVNKRPDSTYPTLDCLMVSKSDNCQILNNSIYMTDFITYPGVENYLYGMDIYNLNNLTVANNKVNIVTTGGKLALGTAYPIQITGPITKVNITENDLYSYSNGPNIGIYSQNYYGGTELSITKNKINVTGLAGTHEWALVAGIESQDTDSHVASNMIEVHSVGEVGEYDNIYGISYRQSISGSHKFDIENNTVFSDGYSSVYLLSSDNSTVANNLLVSYNEKVKNGYDGFNYRDLSSQKDISFYNNKVIRAFDYFAELYNNIDGGNNYPTSGNNGISNNVDGSNIKGKDSKTQSYNPLIPGSAKNGNYEQHGKQIVNPSSDDSGVSDNSHDSDDIDNSDSTSNSSIRDILLSYLESNGNIDNELNSTSNTNQNSDVVYNSSDSNPSNVVHNSSNLNPSDVGENTLISESTASATYSSYSNVGESKSISKSYEIKEKTTDEFVPSVFYVVFALFLLICGFKRKKHIFD